MVEEVEVFLEVGGGIGVVGVEAVAGEMVAGGGVEGGGEGIGPGASTGGVGAPAAGGGPVFAGTGGVAVDGDEEDVVFAELAVPLVHAAAALGQGDVGGFGDEEGCVEAPGTPGKKTQAKEELFQHILTLIKDANGDAGFDIYENTQPETGRGRWRVPYRHWKFVPAEFREKKA